VPSPEAFDWIRLKSGEWLKGEIKYLRDETMLFDSDELDELEIDWVDIKELRSPRRHTYILEGRRIVTGTAVLADGNMVIGTEDGDREFRSTKLVSIVAGDATERSWWSGDLTIGLIAQTGNTEQTDFNSRLNIKREAPVTRLSFLYTGVTSTQDDERTASNNRANLSLDIYVSRRFFVTAPTVAFYRDEFQNINYQITPGAGVGYDLFKTRWVEWEIGGGAAYQYTDFISTLTRDSTSSDVALLASTELNFDFTKDIEFDNSYQLQFVATNPGLTSHHLISSLSFDIWGPLELDVSLTWDRVEDPVTDAGGDQPESDDARLSVGITVDF
jgi:putative salt-induced outer membrane protein YdiY